MVRAEINKIENIKIENAKKNTKPEVGLKIKKTDKSLVRLTKYYNRRLHE